MVQKCNKVNMHSRCFSGYIFLNWNSALHLHCITHSQRSTANGQRSTVNSQRPTAYTLIEILVVMTIIVILLLLTFPSIRAMQAASGRAEAYNTINAALQAARSYAIMHGVNTAARFQPNGKIFLVYKFTGNGKSKTIDWGGNVLNPYPDSAGGTPNADGYIYLPVIDQKPLILPRGYAVADVPQSATFDEPFYVCYKTDGTLAVDEQIFVAMVDDESASTPKPVNPNFDGNSKYGWRQTDWPPFSSYDLSEWIKYIYNERSSGNNDIDDVNDSNDRKLARYVFIAGSDSDRAAILEDQEKGPDYYAGTKGALYVPATSQIALFKTPDNWNDLAIYSTSGDDKADYVNNLNANQFETIYINPYTGRVIRPVK